MLSKSLIQFSVDGWSSFPSLLFDLRSNYGGGNHHNGNLLPKVPCTHCHTQGSRLCRGPQLIHTSSRDSWRLTGKSASVSVGPQLLSSGSWCTQGFVCALQESVSPVLCKFWGLYVGVNGHLLQESLCHTQVCYTQSPCPCGRPLQETNTQRQVWLSLCGYSWLHKVLFEPSKHLWWVWNLSLNAILPLLLSCWGFSLALGYEVSFSGGIQHSPVSSYSAVSCSFQVLTGEDEHK